MLMPEAWAQQLPRLNLRSRALPRIQPTANATPRAARINLRAGGRFVARPQFAVRPTAPAPKPSGGANTGGTTGSTSPAATQATVTVVPTDQAKRYHKDKLCRTIIGPQVATSVVWPLTKAKNDGRTPCQVCYPPPANPSPKTPPKN